MHEPQKRLGELNGFHASMFKVAMATYPLFLTWMAGFTIWVAASLFELKAQANVGRRFTGEMADSMAMQLNATVDSKLNMLAGTIAKDITDIRIALQAMPKETPPKWWEDYVRENIKAHDERLKRLEGRSP
jgi:hypothetical protein